MSSWLPGDAGAIQRRPEPVPRSGEVRVRGRGPQPRVDPDDQQPKTRREEVVDARALKSRQLRPGEPAEAGSSRARVRASSRADRRAVRRYMSHCSCRGGRELPVTCRPAAWRDRLAVEHRQHRAGRGTGPLTPAGGCHAPIFRRPPARHRPVAATAAAALAVVQDDPSRPSHRLGRGAVIGQRSSPSPRRSSPSSSARIANRERVGIFDFVTGLEPDELDPLLRAQSVLTMSVDPSIDAATATWVDISPTGGVVTFVDLDGRIRALVHFELWEAGWFAVGLDRCVPAA